MKFLTALLPIIFSALLLTACDLSGSTDSDVIDDIDTEIFKNNSGTNIEFVEFKKGYYGNHYQDQNIVIRNADEFDTLWKNLFQNRKPIPDYPSINFSKKMLLFTMRKTKPNGGYTTQISKVVKTNNALAVKIDNTNPGDNCGVTQALTTPYQIVKIDKYDQAVEFYEKTTVQSCEE